MLGHGGFGVVLLALDRRLGREVALKVPRPEILVSREMRQRFLREAQAAAVLDHPNIVPVYDGGEIGPVCYLTTRYIAGPDSCRVAAKRAGAAVRVERRPNWWRYWPTPCIMPIVAACCTAISNRRMCCWNRLDQPAGDTLPFSPRLTDFGLARHIDRDEQFTRHGALVGTPR